MPVKQGMKAMVMSVSQGAVGLCVNIFVLIMIERGYGEAGLGVFSYLLSLYVMAGFIAEFGITNLVEREVAINEKAAEDLVQQSFCTLFFLGIFFSGVLIITATYNAGHTKVNEHLIAYIIIASALPIRNFNQLKLAILQGSGRHDTVATLQLRRHLIFILTILGITAVNLRASYLTLGFLASEVGQAIYAGKQIKLPALNILWRRTKAISETLTRAYQYIITDNALDVIFYLDFFILGMFVSSRALGFYAEASVLVKAFLLVPMCIKPILRERYCDQSAECDYAVLAFVMRKVSAWIFFIHAVTALYVLVYYPLVINKLFHFHGEYDVSFRIFATLLPGLLYFTAVIPREPLYEAIDKASDLQKIIIRIAMINAGLSAYFIPFAGNFGAAFSTTAAMLSYFFIFDHYLDEIYKTRVTTYISAGASVYLVYALFHYMDLQFVISFWLMPVVLFVLLVLTGFFEIKNNEEIVNNRN